MKTFIDCGYYSGRALDYYAPLLDDSWKVYAFEPNPSLEFDFSRFPFKVELINKAVWIEDGEIEFVIGGRDDASYIAEMHKGVGTTFKVPSIDFSKFVAGLEGKVVVSMDIEGAEFFVLDKMIEDGTASKIDLLDIEFHHRITQRDTQEASQLRIALESLGIMVKTKVDL
jgi:FkbM family methyltransferase